jgi:hypothetical protein
VPDAARFHENINFVITAVTFFFTYLHFDSDDEGREIGAERPEHHKS